MAGRPTTVAQLEESHRNRAATPDIGKRKKTHGNISQMFHVWNIYLHVWNFWGKYQVNIPYMEHLGKESLEKI